MRNLTFIFVFLLNFSVLGTGFCQEASNSAEKQTNQYFKAGARINVETILSAGQMQQNYRDLKPGDTVEVGFKANVNSVCKSKGCWMKVALDKDTEVMVKFKDYAFFVPKDIEGKMVTVSGLAYVEEISVEEQRHYAKDAGCTPEEIKAIVKPKNTLSFLADGVKFKK